MRYYSDYEAFSHLQAYRILYLEGCVFKEEKAVHLRGGQSLLFFSSSSRFSVFFLMLMTYGGVNYFLEKCIAMLGRFNFSLS